MKLKQVRGDGGDGVEVRGSRLLRCCWSGRLALVVHGRAVVRRERPGEERRRRRPPREGRVPVPSPAAATTKTNDTRPERDLAALVQGREPQQREREQACHEPKEEEDREVEYFDDLVLRPDLESCGLCRKVSRLRLLGDVMRINLGVVR